MEEKNVEIIRQMPRTSKPSCHAHGLFSLCMRIISFSLHALSTRNARLTTQFIQHIPKEFCVHNIVVVVVVVVAVIILRTHAKKMRMDHALVNTFINVLKAANRIAFHTNFVRWHLGVVLCIFFYFKQNVYTTNSHGML